MRVYAAKAKSAAALLRRLQKRIMYICLNLGIEFRFVKVSGSPEAKLQALDH